jgi:hypothetical protein
MYWRLSSWGVVPPAYLAQLRDFVSLLASGTEVDFRRAQYLGKRLALAVEVTA